MIRLTPTPGIEGRVLRRGDEGYERLRRGACWHQRVPDRFPEVVVLATSEADVVGAVELARREGLRIAVRSGGHSWSGSHLRDGTVLIDLSNLRQVDVDVDAMAGTVQPGLRGSELDRILAPHRLFFPVGHSAGVGLGGYLLQGGYGWAGGDHGPACMSVTGIDAVTAAGELIHADETQNADLFWAARGSGPGFFAVVTRFYLRFHPRRPVIMRSGYLFPVDAVPEVFGFMHELGAHTPTELSAAVTRPDGGDGPLLAMLGAIAFTDTEEEAREQLSALEACPARQQAIRVERNQRTEISSMVQGADHALINDDMRWVADNMGTHAPFADLWPTMKHLLDTWPVARQTHLVVWNWKRAGQPERPPMAFSMEDELFYALYAAWSNPHDDDRHIDWVTDHMRAWEPHSSGTMLSDENLSNRPSRFVSGSNLRRLDDLRTQWDSEGVFVPWLGRPQLA